MKKPFILFATVSLLFVSSCGTKKSINGHASSQSMSSSLTSFPSEAVSSNITSNNIISSNEEVNSSSLVTSCTSSEKITSSSIDVVSSTSINTPSGTNPDGGGQRLPLPTNIDDKYEIGQDNKTMTTFAFENSSLPKYFRYIYGNNFVKGNYYADGSAKFSSSTAAKQGFQTGYFIGNKKLEIRIHVGNLYNSNDGNKIDKNSPVMSIYGFSENGTLLQQVYINEINKDNENQFIRTYMAGNDVAYLEFRFMQLPYKGSQAYNISLKGISLIAWPYEL
ncbi:MAG: hypothetical protein PUG37_05925 [Bacillales bacterium]|nr:hypothetical protein [Bacillales bacterium]